MSEITGKINALRSNSDTFKQSLTVLQLEPMVKKQAETIESLENKNKKHGEEIKELKLKLTESNQKWAEVTIKNWTLHSSIAGLSQSLNNYVDLIHRRYEGDESVDSFHSTNLELFRSHEEIIQLKLQLTKKENELSDVMVSNRFLSNQSILLHECVHIKTTLNLALLDHIRSCKWIRDDKQLEESESKTEQLAFKLTEIQQKLVGETKKYYASLEDTRKRRAKTCDDLLHQPQPVKKLKIMSNADKECEFQDEVITDSNQGQLMNESSSLNTSAHEGRKTRKRMVENDDGPVSKIVA